MWRFGGVDIGGSRKGHHFALIEGQTLVDHGRGRSADEVARWFTARQAALVGVDSPRRWAAPGEPSRPDERALAAAGICRLFFTPNEQVARGHPFYAWMFSGMAVFQALVDSDIPAVESFPTATWTQLFGPRRGLPRGAWTRAALDDLGLDGIPSRQGQDLRDAIGAAYTAALHALGRTITFGDLVVPARGARLDRHT